MNVYMPRLQSSNWHYRVATGKDPGKGSCSREKEFRLLPDSRGIAMLM